MNVKLSTFAKIIAGNLLPFLKKKPGSGGSFSSLYCYSVWFRHVVHLKKAGLISGIQDINKMAEIGPGDSLGIGIAGLFCGVKEYYGFDVMEHTNLKENIKIAEDICNYYLEKMEIPHGEKMERTNPKLDDYTFPADIIPVNLSKEYLTEKLSAINKALNKESSSVKIQYAAPWDADSITNKGELDFIFSQAVMMHVDGLQAAYNAMNKWLKKDGIISHQIDYKSTGVTNKWNGHWYLSESLWKFILNGRKYSLNRLPHSAHIKAIEKAGFEVKNVVPLHNKNEYPNKTPKVPNIQFEESDFTISGAFIQAQKIRDI